MSFCCGSVISFSRADVLVDGGWRGMAATHAAAADAAGPGASPPRQQPERPRLICEWCLANRLCRPCSLIAISAPLVAGPSATHVPVPRQHALARIAASAYLRAHRRRGKTFNSHTSENCKGRSTFSRRLCRV